MAQNAWLNVTASNDILFNTPPEGRFDAALAVLGINPLSLASEAGHA
jgi:putative transcriptional regulator